MDNLGLDDKIIENLNLNQMAARGCNSTCDKGFISSREIRGSALVEISGDSDDSRSRGTEEEKFTILSPYENL